MIPEPAASAALRIPKTVARQIRYHRGQSPLRGCIVTMPRILQTNTATSPTYRPNAHNHLDLRATGTAQGREGTGSENRWQRGLAAGLLGLLLLAALAIPTVARAMPTVSGTTINLPSAPGWYQVQDATTFATICEGQIARCDVTPGSYIVINHTTSERFENVQVAQPGTTPPTTSPGTPSTNLSVSHVSLNCTALHQGFNAPANCTMACPGNGVAIGASCEARWAFIIPNHVLGTSTALQPNGVRCSLTSTPDFVPTVAEGNAPTAEFTGHLACLN